MFGEYHAGRKEKGRHERQILQDAGIATDVYDCVLRLVQAPVRYHQGSTHA
jgi:hypothetical protein